MRVPVEARVVTFVLILGSAITACRAGSAEQPRSSNNNPETSSTESSTSAESTPVLVLPRSCYSRDTESECQELTVEETSEASYVEGPIVVDNDCVYVRYLNGTVGAVIFPFGTEWDDAEQAVVLANGDLLHEGEWFTGGGGGLKLHEQTAEALGDVLDARLRRCMSYPGIDPVSYFRQAWGGIVTKIPDPTVSVP